MSYTLPILKSRLWSVLECTTFTSILFSFIWNTFRVYFAVVCLRVFIYHEVGIEKNCKHKWQTRR